MKASPIPYIKDAKLRGSLFDSNESTGLIVGVDTNFYIDHEEPLQALHVIREHWRWPLGELPEGHEYLLVLPNKFPGLRIVFLV